MSNQRNTENPTGAGKKPALRVAFDSRLKLEFHGGKVTSDAGLLAYQELDEALSLTDLSDDLLNDWRTWKNTQHSMVALMRQSIFSRLKEETQPSQGNTGNHGGGVFSSGRKWALGAKSGIETALCRRITGTDWKKVFANRWNRKRITKKAHAGRGLETIWEMSIN
jgi:hypothetical protein